MKEATGSSPMLVQRCYVMDLRLQALISTVNAHSTSFFTSPLTWKVRQTQFEASYTNTSSRKQSSNHVTSEMVPSWRLHFSISPLSFILQTAIAKGRWCCITPEISPIIPVLSVLCVFLLVYLWMCQDSHVSIREQLACVCSSFPPCEIQQRSSGLAATTIGLWASSKSFTFLLWNQKKSGTLMTRSENIWKNSFRIQKQSAFPESEERKDTPKLHSYSIISNLLPSEISFKDKQCGFVSEHRVNPIVNSLMKVSKNVLLKMFQKYIGW